MIFNVGFMFKLLSTWTCWVNNCIGVSFGIMDRAYFMYWIKKMLIYDLVTDMTVAQVLRYWDISVFTNSCWLSIRFFENHKYQTWLTWLYPLFLLFLFSCVFIYLAAKGSSDLILQRNIDRTWCYQMVQFLDISGLNFNDPVLLLFVGCFEIGSVIITKS